MTFDFWFACAVTNQQHTMIEVRVLNMIEKRLYEQGFSIKGKCLTQERLFTKLVWFAGFTRRQHAEAFAQKMTAWERKKKLALIMHTNPHFKDLWKRNFNCEKVLTLSSLLPVPSLASYHHDSGPPHYSHDLQEPLI